MYLLETIDDSPEIPIAMTSLSQPTSPEQWHQCLTHCSPLTIQDMSNKSLVDNLKISEMAINGKWHLIFGGHLMSNLPEERYI